MKGTRDQATSGRQPVLPRVVSLKAVVAKGVDICIQCHSRVHYVGVTGGCQGDSQSLL